MKMSRGLTLLDVTLAGVIFTVLLFAATSAMIVDSSTHRVLIAEMGPGARAQRALRRLVAELRMAGLNAEDINGNGRLDAGEDANDNGKLDADWNLSDKTTDQSDLVFNRRVEIRYTAEDLAPSTVYSRKITYKVVNKALVRETVSTDFATNQTRTRSHVMTRNVDAIRFSRKGNVITVEIDVLYPEKLFKTSKRTVSEKVWLRN